MSERICILTALFSNDTPALYLFDLQGVVVRSEVLIAPIGSDQQKHSLEKNSTKQSASAIVLRNTACTSAMDTYYAMQVIPKVLAILFGDLTPKCYNLMNKA